MTTESYNRTRKAFKLADALDEGMTRGELPPEDWHAYVEGMKDTEWRAVALLAGVPEPSAATRSAVLAIIDERCSDESPFDGLTGSAAEVVGSPALLMRDDGGIERPEATR